MAAVVVAGPAGERQTAGHRQGTAGVVDRQPEFERRDLHGCGEARVQVDVLDVIDADTRLGERRFADGPQRRRCREVTAFGHEPLVVGRRGRRGGDARQDQAAGEIDLQVGAQQLRVRR